MLCNTTALLLLGAWHLFSRLPDGYNPWSQCPDTQKIVENTRYKLNEHGVLVPSNSPDNIADHVRKYSCFNQTYKRGEYLVPGCRFASFQESLHSIKKTIIKNAKKDRKRERMFHIPERKEVNAVTFPKKIYFVGDSLSAQMYIATRCALESFELLDIIEPVYTVDIFLRNDIPCADICLNNTHIQGVNALLTPCYNCPNGKRKDYLQDYIQHNNTWLNKIPTNTIAVVLGSGSWYNSYKQLIQHNEVYEETIRKLSPYLANLRTQQPHLPLYWLGLPPIIPTIMHDLYDWNSFFTKDTIAAKIVRPLDIRYLNTTHLLDIRKNLNNMICVDGIHWCNPGEYSAPYFLSQILFHLLSRDLPALYSSTSSSTSSTGTTRTTRTAADTTTSRDAEYPSTYSDHPAIPATNHS